MANFVERTEKLAELSDLRRDQKIMQRKTTESAGQETLQNAHTREMNDAGQQ